MWRSLSGLRSSRRIPQWTQPATVVHRRSNSVSSKRLLRVPLSSPHNDRPLAVAPLRRSALKDTGFLRWQFHASTLTPSIGSLSFMPLHQQHQMHQYSIARWKSTSRDDENRAQTGSSSSSFKEYLHKSEPMQAPTESPQEQLPKENSLSASSARERLASGAVAATHQIQRVAKDLIWHSEFVPLVLTALLTVILIASPFAAHHMQEQVDRHGGYDHRLQTDDPVDEFAKLARREWQMTDEADGGTPEVVDVNVVELLLKDVFKSSALQHAAQDFLIQIMQSERFKEAASRLVKELWSDLVTDPETVAQVVRLLEIVIQNPSVKQAATDLVLQLVLREPDIRQALLDMIQNLSQDDVVRQAVVSLITDAAHTTLNDPDVLDHSMEFATDVVGDDVVQQTAGEALRKSVGYAVKPATSVFLTALGVGLMIFSVIAVGYSRSSDQEAVLFESAARSLHSNAMTGIMRIVTWPLRALDYALSSVHASIWTLLTPPEGETLTLDLLASRIVDAVIHATNQAASLSIWAASTASQWMHNALCLVREKAPRSSSALVAVGAYACTVWSSTMAWAHEFGKMTVATIVTLGSLVVGKVIKLASALHNQWKGSLEST